jgi:adenosylcobinamide-GDP ribazoletransferase
MTLFRTIALAFSMFSAIPVPRVVWNEKNMRYLMCAFPLVGVVIGGLFLAWLKITLVLQVSVPVAALGCTLIPVLTSGGIHLDGFCDTCDALASHADREKKLAILKDSHAGAFAVIGCVCYFLAYYVLAATFVTALTRDPSRLMTAGAGMAAVFVLERMLSALAVAVFPCAKNSGLVHTFSDAAARKQVALFNTAAIIALIVLLIIWCGAYGGMITAVAGGVFMYYYSMSKQQFGGITGDIAGWFVQTAELAGLASVIFAGRFL